MLSRRAPLLLFIFLTIPSFAFADQWVAKFGSAIPEPPIAGWVQDVLADGNDLYVVCGGASSANVAKWDGSSWTNLGGNFQYSTQIYLLMRIERFKQWVAVSGIFRVNGQLADVALWDGATWSALQLSLDTATAICSDGTYLYVAGRGAQANYDAMRRWDGAVETSLPSAPGPIATIIEWNGHIYASGNSFVNWWDGTQWNPTANVSGPGELTVYNNELYVEGSSGVLKWTGTSWTIVAPYLEPCQDVDIRFYGDRLYRTAVSWPPPFRNSAMFKNGVWNNMNGGLFGGCYGRLAEYQGRLLIAGDFDSCGGFPSPRIAMWDGDRWRMRGTDSGVSAIASNGSVVFVGGTFENAFNTPAHHIARWDGSNWSALGSGIDGTVNTAMVLENDLYVGGEFTDAGGSGAQNLAKWDGSQWSPVGPSLGGPVYSLATDGTSVYVGGDFATFQGEFLQGIAQWDGTSFHPLGTGISGGSVRAIQLSGNLVYAAGDFTTADGQFTGNTAVWNGSWNTLGNGINGGTVRDLEIFNGALYACGDFYSYPIQRLAYFNGSQWTAISPGLDGPAYAMQSMAGNLYITGLFTKAGGNTANRIARWNGTAFSTLGSGLDATGRAITAGPAGIWLGGDFRSTGGLGAAFVGHYALTPTAVGLSLATRTSLDPVFPNPFNPSTNIRFRVGSGSRVTIAIYDVQGRLVRQLLDENVPGSTTQHVITWDGRSGIGTPAASGVYFVRMSAKGYNETRKVVLLK